MNSLPEVIRGNPQGPVWLTRLTRTDRRINWALIWFLIVGFVAGLLARAVVPGRDAMGILQTIVLGLVGSLVGGVIGGPFHETRPSTDFTTSGLIGSIIGAIVALLIYRQMKKA